MTPEEKATLDALCQQIAAEKNPQTFHQLLVQLNDLLERKGKDWKNPSTREANRHGSEIIQLNPLAVNCQAPPPAQT